MKKINRVFMIAMLVGLVSTSVSAQINPTKFMRAEASLEELNFDNPANYELGKQFMMLKDLTLSDNHVKASMLVKHMRMSVNSQLLNYVSKNPNFFEDEFLEFDEYAMSLMDLDKRLYNLQGDFVRRK